MKLVIILLLLLANRIVSQQNDDVPIGDANSSASNQPVYEDNNSTNSTEHIDPSEILTSDSADIIENTYEDPEKENNSRQAIEENEEKDELTAKKDEIEQKIKDNLLLKSDFIYTLQISDSNDDNYPDIVSYGLIQKNQSQLNNLDSFKIWTIVNELSMNAWIRLKSIDEDECKVKILYEQNQNSLEEFVDKQKYKKEDGIRVELDNEIQLVYFMYQDCKEQVGHRMVLEIEIEEANQFLQKKGAQMIRLEYVLKIVPDSNTSNDLYFQIGDYQYQALKNGQQEVRQIHMNTIQQQMNIKFDTQRNKIVYQQQSHMKRKTVNDDVVELTPLCDSQDYFNEQLLIIDTQTTKKYLFEVHKQCVIKRQQELRFFHKLSKERKFHKQAYTLREVRKNEVVYLETDEDSQQIYVKTNIDGDRPIFIEEYQVMSNKMSIYYMNLEGRFLKKDINALQKNQQILTFVVVFKCMYQGTGENQLMIKDSNNKEYVLNFNKKCGDDYVQQTESKAGVGAVLWMGLGLGLIVFLYIRLKRRNVYQLLS